MQHYPELTELTVDRGEVSSTPASDTSWDQVDEQDTRITLWVPDHVAVDCSACHVVFNIVTRKHHCRFVTVRFDSIYYCSDFYYFVYCLYSENACVLQKMWPRVLW